MPEMPLEVGLLKDASVIVSITDTAFRAAVLLWAASWHQIPAASLPDDDRILALLSGYGKSVSEFIEIKDQALWKFIKCSDGRWYHPTIANKAIRTWEYRQSYRKRMAEARAAKADKNQKPERGKRRSVTEAIKASITDPVTELNQTKPNGKESTSFTKSGLIQIGEPLRLQLASLGHSRGK